VLSERIVAKPEVGQWLRVLPLSSPAAIADLLGFGCLTTRSQIAPTRFPAQLLPIKLLNAYHEIGLPARGVLPPHVNDAPSGKAPRILPGYHVCDLFSPENAMESTMKRNDDHAPTQTSVASNPVLMHVGMTLRQAEKLLIVATLQHTEGNVREAARTLGINRSTLY
jgi:DNA-binding NtrC family response regulator